MDRASESVSPKLYSLSLPVLLCSDVLHRGGPPAVQPWPQCWQIGCEET